MKTCLSIFILIISWASSMLAQGAVTVSGAIVTADATLAPEPVRCTFQKVNFGSLSILTFCYVGGVIQFYQNMEPAVGSTTGATEIFLKVPNVVTWTLKQPSAGVFTWNVIANGTGSLGTF